MKIAISGPMCSGKTTVAKIITEINSEYEIFSFGGKIKEIASELFDMKNKDRSLLINIASKMREINEDVWVKYIIDKTKDKQLCVVDDLRFQNELNYLSDWKIICLVTPENERIKRIKSLYKDDYTDHIKNMKHISEAGNLSFPTNTEYLDTTMTIEELKEKIMVIMGKQV